MGRKLNQASTKISKSENKKQMNSLIYKVLRPKVYITDSSNFKNLVQQLTGNNISSPIPFVQEPVIMENSQNHGNSEMYSHESSSSLESSEGSFPSCFTRFSNSPQSMPSCNYTSLANSPQSMPSCYTSLANSPRSMPSCNYTSSPQESYVPETTFNVLENSFASNNNNELQSSSFGDIESWLLEIDSFSCNWDAFDDHIPAALPELSVYGSDFENLW